jgi:cell wall-associated NlpC family hydrolase
VSPDRVNASTGRTSPDEMTNGAAESMATPHVAAPQSLCSRVSGAVRWTPVRRAALVLSAVLGVLLAMLPAQAAPANPTSSAEAAALVAAKTHDLEVLTEQFNDAQEQLKNAQAQAEAATATLQQAQADLAAAQQHVRGIARSAYTGEGLGEFQAMLSSGSADEFVDRVATLQTIAGHQNEILDAAAAANVTAAQAKATAEKATTAAQAQFDSVTAKQSALESEIAEYQSAFDALSAREQRAAVEAAGGTDRASRDERPAVAPAGPVVASSQAAQIAVDTAMAQRGKPYVWAAAGPDSFDCSGLMAYSYAAAGVGLPHSSRMQSQMGTPVSRDQLQPGDLVFFYSPVSHVGMYIGNGQMVHAPTSGDVVKIADIDSMGGYNSARRITG